MRKPVIYYHPESLPPQYGENEIYRYDTMGFGPVIEKYDELISEVCEYMQEGCVIHDEYRLRADDFFAFDDFNNCKRICDEVVLFDKKITGSDKYGGKVKFKALKNKIKSTRKSKNRFARAIANLIVTAGKALKKIK